MNARLKWYAEGAFEHHAWSTDDGQFLTGQEFRIMPTHLGWQLLVVDLRTYNGDLRVSFNHRAYTLDDVQAAAEALRAALPARTGEAWLPVEEIRRRLADLHRVPDRCTFVHAFPLDASDDTFCQCGRLTKATARRRAS